MRRSRIWSARAPAGSKSPVSEADRHLLLGASDSARGDSAVRSRSDQDRKLLRDYERVLPDLAITDQVWALACDLGDRARRAGISAGAGDLLIAACARVHGAEVEYADADFDLLNSL